ncbi:MAG: biopolymer transporter ExbD, partial [Patescibacteria group bacterium]|nr:biopolymer transporter ExbD [Patescibacteria group bacterium]
MLTSSFRPQEAAIIDTPTSVSEKQSPDKNIMTLLVDKDGKVFFNIDNGKDSSTKFRADVLQEMGSKYNIKFNKTEIERFTKMSSFGMPIKLVKSWLNTRDSKKIEQYQVGMPMDSLDNQLLYWIYCSRKINPNFEVAIKA